MNPLLYKILDEIQDQAQDEIKINEEELTEMDVVLWNSKLIKKKSLGHQI